MNDFDIWLASHHRLVAVFFAALAAYGAYNAFRTGMLTASIIGNNAKTASESMGG